MLISRFPGEILYSGKGYKVGKLPGDFWLWAAMVLSLEVLNGVLKNHRDINIPFGLIPVGTGNSFYQGPGNQLNRRSS
jgi:hypothetical protein